MDKRTKLAKGPTSPKGPKQVIILQIDKRTKIAKGPTSPKDQNNKTNGKL